MLSKRMTILLCVMTGVALELGIHALSGRREAWDSLMYWTLGLPLALAAAFLIGFLSRRLDWMWTFAIVPSQVLTLMVREQEIGNLWPLTVALSSVLSTPFVLVAIVGSRMNPWRSTS